MNTRLGRPAIVRCAEIGEPITAAERGRLWLAAGNRRGWPIVRIAVPVQVRDEQRVIQFGLSTVTAQRLARSITAALQQIDAAAAVERRKAVVRGA